MTWSLVACLNRCFQRSQTCFQVGVTVITVIEEMLRTGMGLSEAVAPASLRSTCIIASRRVVI